MRADNLKPLKSGLRSFTQNGLSFRYEMLLAVLMVLAPLLAGLHASQERHVVCPVHQQVEHADEVHTEGDASVAHAEHVGPELVLPGADEEAHETCALVPSLREQSIVVGANPNKSFQPSFSVRVAPRRAARGHEQVSLLRLAPKQSPPA